MFKLQIHVVRPDHETPDRPSRLVALKVKLPAMQPATLMQPGVALPKLEARRHRVAAA